MSKHPRSLLLTCLTALSLALAGCGGDDAADQPAAERTETRAKPSEIADGTTTLKLSSTITPLLDLAGVDLVPVSPATEGDDGLRVPISKGTIGVDPVAGRLDHRGGIRFSAGGASVEATALRLDLRTGTVTAEVEGERVPLLQARFESARLGEGRQTVALDGEDAALTDEALVLINDTIGSELVPAGLSIGELVVEARWP